MEAFIVRLTQRAYTLAATEGRPAVIHRADISRALLAHPADYAFFLDFLPPEDLAAPALLSALLKNLPAALDAAAAASAAATPVSEAEAAGGGV